jgi:hypothetical protein
MGHGINSAQETNVLVQLNNARLWNIDLPGGPHTQQGAQFYNGPLRQHHPAVSAGLQEALPACRDSRPPVYEPGDRPRRFWVVLMPIIILARIMATVLNVVLRWVPSVLMMVTAAIAIRTALKPYSMAVVDRSAWG